MAFYNPQRVVFNPDTGVIQNAGKVGGVLYDIMSKSFDDKVKAHEFEQEQDLRKQQMEFNQSMQNNQLLHQFVHILHILPVRPNFVIDLML